MNATKKAALIPSAAAALMMIFPHGSPAQTPSAAKSKAVSASASAKAGSATGPEVVGLQIIKPEPPARAEDGDASSGMMMMSTMGAREGTTVHLSLSRPDKLLIGFDEKASKIAAATDDRSTDLARARSAPSGNTGRFHFGGAGGGGPFSATIQPDGHRATVEVHLPQTPARGATKVRLKGQLAFQCGAGEKTVEQKNLSIKDGKITVGPVPMTFGQEDDGFTPPNFGGEAKPSTSLSLHHARPLNSIKTLAFLGPDGKTLPSHRTGQMSSGFGDQQRFTTIYQVEGKVDRVSVKITYFDKVETLTMPLDIEVGVGF